MEKICPFLLMGNPANVAGHANCVEERCALWVLPHLPRYEGRCAIQALGALPHMLK